MLQKTFNNQAETFNDGLLKILKTKDGVIESEYPYALHYGNRVVGASRFYKAAIAGSEIQKVVSVPFVNFIAQRDLIEITSYASGKKEIYKIKQLQEKFDAVPKCIHLTLVRSPIEYDDMRKAA